MPPQLPATAKAMCGARRHVGTSRRAMSVSTVTSWRELDEAIADTSWCCHESRVHSTLVFRGLSRSSYRNVSSLARLEGDYPRLERHLLRNFRKYAHRERPGPTTWDWLAPAQHHGPPTRPPDWAFSPPLPLHLATPTPEDQPPPPWAGGSEGGPP